MNERLKKNVDTQIAMLREVSKYVREMDIANKNERKLLLEAIVSLKKGIKIINSALPGLLEEIGKPKKLPGGKKQKIIVPKMEAVRYRRSGADYDVVLNAKDKERFLKELSISENLVKKVKKRSDEPPEKFEEFQASRGFLRWANKLFLKQASADLARGKFTHLSNSLKKANIDILVESYIASMYLTVTISVVASIVLVLALLFFDIGLSWPIISVYDGSILARLGKTFWLVVAIPALAFFIMYTYPSTERKSVGKKIDQELPFAVIHMSAISGSGIEPSEIFKIIGMSKDYPNLRKEIRKVLNQINLYGYDLVTALNNAARATPSEKLSELFSGFSTTITSGASLKNFLEKRSETLLLSYRLEREGYTRLIETFLDIYISVVVAAPMVFLLLLVLMSVSGIQTGFGPTEISLIAVVGIAVLNIVFLVILQAKQPPY